MERREATRRKGVRDDAVLLTPLPLLLIATVLLIGALISAHSDRASNMHSHMPEPVEWSVHTGALL